MIKHPARWHGDRMRQTLPSICGLQEIERKHKLTVVNALKIVVDGGPTVLQENIKEEDRILIGTDMVAIDSLGGRLIDQERGRRGLKDLAEDNRPPTYLNAARDMKMGQPELDRVDLIEIPM
jgi:hypothetical protein